MATQGGDRRAIVVGHSSGLGLSLATALLARGWSVAGIARRSIGAEALGLAGLPSTLYQLEADLAVEDGVATAVEWIRGEHAGFSRLFYCAAQLVSHPLENLDYGMLEYGFRVNTFAPMILESALLPMFQANGADVVNVTSSSLFVPYPALAEYSASKAALAKFTVDLRLAMENSTGRVMDFCPSGFRSDIYRSMLGSPIDRDESRQMSTELVAQYLLDTMDLPLPIDVEFVQMNRKNPV